MKHFFSRSWPLSLLLTLAFCPKAAALEQTTLLLLTTPLDTQEITQFWSGNLPTDGSIAAANRISQSDLTVPSLWWAQQQFGGNLLNYWVAYSGTDGTPRRIELMVDPQVWNQAGYMERYAFVTRMGATAEDFGYNLRIFTWRGDLLGAYICDFGAASFSASGSVEASSGSSSGSSSDSCNVFLGLSPPGAFQTNGPFGSF